MGIVSKKRSNNNLAYSPDEENKKLRDTVSNLRKELENYKDPPLIVCDVIKVLNEKAIVRLQNGNKFLVSVAPSIIDKIVVGKIVVSRSHPSNKKLQVCEVDVNRSRAVRIVCGAPNARTGVKAAVALPGSTLPSGAKVRPVNIGGEVSGGILCSAAEIGLEDSSIGILEFDTTAIVGQTVNEHLDLDDTVLDIELTPNRGDCLSVLGVAREIAAIRGKPVRKIEFRSQGTSTSNRIPLSVTAPADAPRYVGRVIEGLDASSPTPDWMKERLRRSGLRSLGSIVDVTNFVMLELGQPLHAFDLHAVRNGIVVRHARRGETLTLLDGTELRLVPATLVIADQGGPIGLAGIMGGQTSGVGESTEAIFLESAYFRPDVVAGRAREYGLQTDASYRFERGVDPSQQRRAVLRASMLLTDICSGLPGPVCEVSVASGVILGSSARKEYQENYIKAKSLLDIFKS